MGITLRGLREGEWRPLSRPELALVRDALLAAAAAAAADAASGGGGRPAGPRAGPRASAEDTDADGE